MSSRADPNAELIEVWRANPTRPVLLVDETRFGPSESPHPGETLLVAVVCTRATHLIALLEKMAVLRTSSKRPLAERLKGRKVFGKKRARDRGAREAIAGAILSAEWILEFVTTSQYVRNAHQTGTPLADGTVIDGHEFPLLMLLVKSAANQMGVGAEDVDVLVDRSAQLGLDPTQRGLGADEFQAYIAVQGTLNTRADGTPAMVQSPAGFRVIAVGEETKILGDAILLPDSVAFLSRSTALPLLTDSRLQTGVVPLAPRIGGDFFRLRP